MPKLILSNKDITKDDIYPIAIVKSDNKKYSNNLLFVENNPISKGETKINLPYDSKFSLLPDTRGNKRNIWYIAGASGSGKSFIAKQIAENYNKLYPDRNIFIVSALEEDDTLDNMKVKKNKIIRLDYKEFKADPPDINSVSDCLFIFDDVDTIEDKKGGLEIQKLINDIAIMGRGHKEGQGNISLMFLTHHITNYKKTRLILNEADYYILYPQASATNLLYYLLKMYLGFERKDILKLKKLPSRWVCFHKNAPQFMIWETGAELLHTE
jgi:Cdc6-like AAA superfamily ATPase